MDMICVDITDAPEIQYGTEVILLGNGHNDIRVENLVSLYNGSSYELLCQVGRRAKRYYYEGGRLVTAAPLSRRDFVSSDYPNSKLNQIIQSAIAQRINSEEMSELIFREFCGSSFIIRIGIFVIVKISVTIFFSLKVQIRIIGKRRPL